MIDDDANLGIVGLKKQLKLFCKVRYVTKNKYQKHSFNLNNNSEAVTRKCSLKMVFLKILQNSQENTCAGISFLIKL